VTPFALASRRLTIGLLLAIALAIGVGYRWSGVASGHDGEHLDPTTALLTNNRPGLKICVQSLLPGVEVAAVQRQLTARMADVSKHPDFSRGGLNRQPVAIDAGCPSGPTIAEPGYTRGDKIGAPAIVKEPSPYRLFIFVASEEQIARAFDWQPHLTPQELICEGGGCAEVTTALYLTPQQIADGSASARGLAQGIGLWSEGRERTNPAFDPFGR
jgi:hypothetical protein